MTDTISCPQCGGDLVVDPEHIVTRKTGDEISVCVHCAWPVITKSRPAQDVAFFHRRLPCRGGPFDGSLMPVMLRASDTAVDIPDDPRGKQWRYLVEREHGNAVYLQFVGAV